MKIELYQELKNIKEEIEILTGLSLTKKTRQREYVYARSIYHKLAREQTSYSLAVIGGYLNLDHSTALHAINHTFKQAIDNDIRSRKAYIFFSKTDLSKELKEIYELKEMIDKLDFENVKLKAFNIKLKTQSDVLTTNELLYRQLSETNKAKYDLRVSAILKMLNVANRKESFETINCQA